MTFLLKQFFQNATINTLLVEDDPQIRESLREFLTRNGFSVNSCRSSEQVNQYQSHPNPDLIHLDVTLPDKNEFDYYRSVCQKISVILLTASDDEESVITGQALETNDCITKPFQSRLLLMIVSGQPVSSLSSILMTYIIYSITDMRQETHFYVPTAAICTAVISVFIIIILSMIYGWHKLQKENLVEALRSETA